MKILFSCIGGNDPISNNHDGSILHICRYHRPDKVIMLVSKEMCDLNMDKHCVSCLEKLGESLDHKFECEVIKENDLTDPQNFDLVYPIIKESIKKIKAEMEPEDELYVNIASGTPAMKYCLQFLSALSDYSFTPISVNTPVKGMNTNKTDKKAFNSEEQWADNEDNKIKVNRTRITKSLFMLNEFYQNTLAKLIENYDYSGALTLLGTVNCFSEETKELIEAALQRTQLDTVNAEKTLNKYGFTLPIFDDRKNMVEYALSIANNLKKGRYADFIRAITPLMTDIYIKALEQFCNIDIKNATYIDNGVMKWEEVRNRENQTRRKAKNKIFPVLNKAYKNNFNYKTVYNIHLRKILDAKLKNGSDEKSLIQFMGNIEESVRNIAAHQMVMFTSDDVLARTQSTPEDIFAKLQELMLKLNIPKTVWNSYSDMNEVIIKSIRRMDAEQ